MKNFLLLLVATILSICSSYANTLQLPWGGYWPNIGTKSETVPSEKPQTMAAQANQIQPIPNTTNTALIPYQQQKALVDRDPPSSINTNGPRVRTQIAPTTQQQKLTEETPAPSQTQQPTPTPINTPAATTPPPAAQATTGGSTALSGIGAAFAAIGAMGASSQHNQASHLNPYMAQGRTATERFNCVGKPPAQCQQEWNQLVQRIESIPNVRIIHKSYGCGPNPIATPGIVSTGYPPHPYGTQPGMGYQQPQHGQYPISPYGHPMAGYPANIQN